MIPHVPQTLTLCGHVRSVPGGTLEVVGNVENLEMAYAKKMFSFDDIQQALYFLYQKDDGTVLKMTQWGLEKTGPEILVGCPCIVVSSCSNAIFFVEGSVLPPTTGNFLIHMECVLIDRSVLERDEHFNAQLVPCVRVSESGYVIYNALDELVRPTLLPCYLVKKWAMTLPPVSMIGADFAFMERSVLDEFPVKRGRQVGSKEETVPLDPSSYHGFASMDTADMLAFRRADGRGELVDNIRAPGWSFDLVDAIASVEHECLLETRETPLPNNESLGDLMWCRLLGRVLAFSFKNQLRPGDVPMIDSIICHATAWVFGTLACNHHTSQNEKSGRLRNGFRKLATRFFAQQSGVRRCLEVWHDFVAHHSLARAVFPWLNGFTLDANTIEGWDISFHTMIKVAKRFTLHDLQTIHAHARAQKVGVFRSFDIFERNPEFDYQRQFFDVYMNRMIDRTHVESRQMDTADMNREAFARFRRDGTLPDPEPGTNPAGPVAAGGGDAARDSAYYARKGSHGHGHVYMLGKITDPPFDTNNGKIMTWALVKDVGATMKDLPKADPNRKYLLDLGNQEQVDHSLELLLPFCNIHSPLVVEYEPTGRHGIDYRLTAITDYGSMYFIRNFMQDMAHRFAAKQPAFEAWFQKNMKKVFNEEGTEIVMSNEEKLRLSGEQQAFFKHVTKHPFSIVTGPAGTGKSTLIAALCCCLSGSNKREAEQVATVEETEGLNLKTRAAVPKKNPLLAWLQESPYGLFMGYGKVVSNFTREYGLFATTIHHASALLNRNYWHEDRRIFLDRASPSEATVGIADEVTVLSFSHMIMIFNACPRLMKLIVVGDMNQMESIGRGNIGETLMKLYGKDPRITTRLSHNYRLTNNGDDTVQRFQRTNLAFEAIINGADIGKLPRVYGPYTDKGLGRDLPAIVSLPNWDTATLKRAAERAPILLLPHVETKKTAIDSLEATMEKLVAFIGRDPKQWENVQVLTQRREDVNSITNYLTRVLFPGIELGYGGKPAYNDLYVGEHVVIHERIQGFSPNGSKCTISKNDICIIKSIEDCTQITMKTENGDRVVFKNIQPRASTRKFVPGRFPLNHKRVIRFTNGYYVVVDYPSADSNRSIDFLRRGICTTNASMQGSGAVTIATFVRRGVSYTYDRRQFYTSVSRMKHLCIIISALDELKKVIARAPPTRNNQLGEILGTVDFFPED